MEKADPGIGMTKNRKPDKQNGACPIENRSRAKRNRKRPRSQVHSNENLKIETSIKRLEFDGKPILDKAGGAEQYIRVIHPYPYTFSSFAKQRWVGRTVLDVYVSEFGSYPESYYRAAIRQGRILVSDNKVDVDYKIQGKDVLTHIVHRHEPSVAVYSNSAGKTGNDANQFTTNLVKIIEETDDLIILDKPGTLPIHPCGGYHLNSLTSILEGESIAAAGHANKKYFNIHRLDRLTSGLVILAKSTDVAKHWSQCIRQRNCQKYYLARVRGKFPMNLEKSGIERIGTDSCTNNATPRDGEWTDSKPFDSSTQVDTARRQNAHGYWITDARSDTVRRDVSLAEIAHLSASVNDWLKQVENEEATKAGQSSQLFWLHLACPTRISKPKNGVCEAGTFEELADDVYLKTVKPAQTSFGVVSYDTTSDSTLLICRPVTGRTHQIRLHLQHVGHPIANDPNYGGDIWYRNEEGKEACSKAHALLRHSIAGIESADEDFFDRNTADVPASEEEIFQLADTVQNEEESVEEFIRRTCVWCARTAGRDIVEHSMLEFLLRSRGIWLHALQYRIGAESGDEGNKISRFRTQLPSWALP